MNRKKSVSSSFVLLNVPSMGESVSQAVVGRLLVDSADFVEEGQDLIELETDKLNQTLSAPASGILHWQVEVGQSVAIGELLAKIEAKEGVKTPKNEILPPEKPVSESNVPVSSKEIAPLPGLAMLEKPQKAAKASSSNIRILREAALEDDFSGVEAAQASFEHKREDKVVELPKVVMREGSFKETRERLPQMRKTIAQRLLKAQQETAMLTTFNEIDMSAVMQLREKFSEKFLQKHGVKLGFMSFFTKAVVAALKKVPALNARIEGEEWVQRLDYHLGVAVSTDKGLVVPVIRNCDLLSLVDIEKQIAALAVKAREGKITLEDLQGGSFTLTNGGVFGSLLSTPILNPPQSGILGMHKIQKRPVVNEKDEIVARPMMYIALTYDHRVVDGKQAVSFLVAIKEAIEQPEVLWLDI